MIKNKEYFIVNIKDILTIMELQLNCLHGLNELIIQL
jgi:hypothetical protein